MNLDFIEKLYYSYSGENNPFPLPLCLKNALNLISDYFKNNDNNKLCLVFPAKEYVAQWIALPLALTQIKSDYTKYYDEIYEAYKRYKPGQKLFLNNKAIVQWVDGNEHSLTFKTKGRVHRNNPWMNTDGDKITISTEKINNLKPAPSDRKLSSKKTVYKNLRSTTEHPLDNLLSINSNGNLQFRKNTVCLITKIVSYNESMNNILVNNWTINDYFKFSKIDENGNSPHNGPLQISNSLLNLILYLGESNHASFIIIDGFNTITSESDFSDIDRKYNIPTVLITDLSEIDQFEEIKNHGFDFFKFTKDKLSIAQNSENSPFAVFEKKIGKYISFSFNKEICNDPDMESITDKLHTLTNNDSDEDFNVLRISLIRLTNILSRICYLPKQSEILDYRENLNKIEIHFQGCQLWLGEARDLIQDIITLLKQYIERLAKVKTEKCSKLDEILTGNVEFVICPTENETHKLREYLDKDTVQIISIADINDGILSQGITKAILTGWPKSSNFNRLLSSFLFSELTVLFYQFENKYFTSLQRRNKKSNNIISSGDISNTTDGFQDLFFIDNQAIDTTESDEHSFDIVDFELRLENTQYTKYSGKGNIVESCKARRIGFENDTFLYATESHKFIVITDLIESHKSTPSISSKKTEILHMGDIIAFINTDRDVLVDIVEKNTKPDELAEVKQWIELWKNLLRDHFSTIGYDIKRLVEDLRKHDCKKHEATIKAWLQDDNRIGPDDDADLISIALLTKSEELLDNIPVIRKSIGQMISWRMKASSVVRDKIKNRLMEITKDYAASSPLEIPDLGRVEILRIIEVHKKWEDIDKKYVNRLFQKDII